MRRPNVFLLALATLVSTTSVTGAQSAVPSDSACSYRACALTIVPTWNGLAVVQGTSGARVANLNFFLPRDISGPLGGRGARVAGADSAEAEAGRALTLRRIGALLTDAGLLVAGVAA